MKLPLGTSVKITTTTHSGLLRPKQFIDVSLHSKELDCSVHVYLVSSPVLLRLRLYLAMLKAKRMIQKMCKYKQNQGI
jgi:hypothetical protein